MQKKLERPFVVIKYAQSLDGKIATSRGESKWISGNKSREFTHILRAKNDAILVGINTVLKDDPMLNVRHVCGHSPIRIILDSSLKIPIDSNIVITAKEIKTIIFTSKKSLAKKNKDILFNKGIEIIAVKTKLGKLALKEILDNLAQKKIKSLLIEGGSEVISAFIQQKIVDKIYIVIAPIIIGADGISSIRNIGECHKSFFQDKERNFKVKQSIQKGENRKNYVSQAQHSCSLKAISPGEKENLIPSNASIFKTLNFKILDMFRIEDDLVLELSEK